MGSLIFFLLIACLLSILALASRSRSIRSRMLLGPFLAAIYGLNVIGHVEIAPQALLVVGLFWALIFRYWEHLSLDHFKHALAPLATATLIVCFVAFRPSLLEYPADHINYWQNLLEATGVGSARALACGLGDISIYDSSCTLWLKLAGVRPAFDSLIVSGLYGRLVHYGELFLLSLALIRFWMFEGIKPLSASCMIVLVFAGTGYLYDAFVINHALQGSILASAVFVECSSVLCWIFSRLREHHRKPSAEIVLVVSWYALSVFYLLLLIKLHGAFALMLLVWILISPVVISLAGPFGCCIGRLSRFLFFAISSASTVFLFVNSKASEILIPPNFSGVVFLWRNILGLSRWDSAWPAFYIPRTSDTRPEALAFIGLLVSICAMSFLYYTRKESRFNLTRDRLLAPNHALVASVEHFIFITSIYVVSILLAYTLPPFSNLFLKLNPDYSSHMRLMWGACLVSPLPALLFGIAGYRSIRPISLGIMVVILCPIQFHSGQRQQIFFSKLRHFIFPTPEWADPSQIAAAVIPDLLRLKVLDSRADNPVVLADPVVRSALHPFGIAMAPPSAIGADRIFQIPERPSRIYDDIRLPSGLAKTLLLDTYREINVVIQQRPRDCFYSVYSDMKAYDPCVAARVVAQGVNRLSPKALISRGFTLHREFDHLGLMIWRR